MKSMRRLSLILMLAGSLVILFANGAFAVGELRDVTSFRCPEGQIVSIGDTRFNVLEKCGKPTFTDNYGAVWVYDFGPKEFVRYIVFSGDVVGQIRVGNYGLEEGRPSHQK